ncbi:hypothetical protein ACET9H_16380 [Aeromonas media]|uniref:hypothetical protein n=1 Tax=Aeromonas media TaxID=651 RepID=UPI0038CF3009
MMKLKAAPEWAFPRAGTKAHKLLMLMADGEPVSDEVIAREVGKHWERAIQTLRGEPHLWRLISILGPDGLIDARSLDQRHLSGCPDQDHRARAERGAELASLSHKGAMDGHARLPRTTRTLEERRRELAELERKDAPTEAEA